MTEPWSPLLDTNLFQPLVNTAEDTVVEDENSCGMREGETYAIIHLFGKL